MEQIVQAFFPVNGGISGSVKSGTISGTSGQVAVPKLEGQNAIRLFNSGTDVIFVCFGKTATAVAAADVCIAMAPNSVEVFSLPPYLANSALAYVGYIAAGASSNVLYVTPGNGQ